MAEHKCWTDVHKIDKNKRRLLRTEFHKLVQEAFDMTTELEEKREECEHMFEKFLLYHRGSIHPAAFLGPINELDVWHWSEGHYAPLVLKKECTIKHGKYASRRGMVDGFDEKTHKYKIALLKEDSDEAAETGEYVTLPRKEFKVQVTLDYFQSVFADINAEKDTNYYSWLSEFFDLILVAAIFRMAANAKNGIKANREGSHIDLFVIYFLYFNLFLMHTMVWTRFTDVEGLLDDIMHQTFGFGMLLMSVFIPEYSRVFHEPLGILLGWLISVFSLLILHIYYYYVVPDPSCDRYCRRRIVALLISVFMACFALTSDHDDQDRLSTASAIGFLLSALPIFIVELNSVRMNSDQINPTTEFLSERLGILALILMGESIFALALIDMEKVSKAARRLLLEGRRLLAPAAEDCRRFLASSDSSYGCRPEIDMSDSDVWSSVLAICFAYILIMLIYMLYFTGHIGKSEYGFHALDNAGVLGSVTWLGSHMFYGFFLVLLGLGMKLLIYGIESKETKYLQQANDTITSALIAIVFFSYVIRFSHKQFFLPLKSRILRFLSIGIVALGFCNRGDEISAEEILAVAVGTMMVVVALDGHLRPSEDLLILVEEEGHGHGHGGDDDEDEYDGHDDTGVVQKKTSLQIGDDSSMVRTPSVHAYKKAKGVHRAQIVDSKSAMIENSQRRTVTTLDDVKAFRKKNLDMGMSMMGLEAWKSSDSEEDEDLSSVGDMDIQYDFVAEDIGKAVAYASDHENGGMTIEVTNVDEDEDDKKREPTTSDIPVHC